jgi:hypothetical protein
MTVSSVWESDHRPGYGAYAATVGHGPAHEADDREAVLADPAISPHQPRRRSTGKRIS